MVCPCTIKYLCKNKRFKEVNKKALKKGKTFISFNKKDFDIPWDRHRQRVYKHGGT